MLENNALTGHPALPSHRQNSAHLSACDHQAPPPPSQPPPFKPDLPLVPSPVLREPLSIPPQPPPACRMEPLRPLPPPPTPQLRPSSSSSTSSSASASPSPSPFPPPSPSFSSFSSSSAAATSSTLSSSSPPSRPRRDGARSRERPLTRTRFTKSHIPRGKLSYDGEGLTCEFCNKTKHDESFCPSKRTIPEPGEECEWAEKLITSPRIDLAMYEDISQEEALKVWHTVGADLNDGNPHAGSEEACHALKAKLGFWKALGCEASVLSFLWYGLPSRVHGEPQPHWFENWSSTMENMDFVEAELAKNLAKGVWVEVPQEFVTLSSPLQVEWNPFKQKARLCVDMRYYNSFLAYVQFKMETLRKHGPDVVRPGQKLFTIDLEAAYHWLTLAPEMLPYSCFEFKGKFYCSLVPNFGWSLCPFYFTKVTRPLVGFFRVLGVDCSIYLDDFLFGARPENEDIVYAFTTGVIKQLGWTISEKSMKKAEWEAVFLGVLIDARKMEYRVPQTKVERLLATLRNLTTANSVSTEALHSLEGTLGSMSLAIPAVMIWVRYFARARCKREQRGVVTAPLTDELKWLAEVKKLVLEHNGAPINPPSATIRAHVDAGGLGAGAQLHMPDGEDEDIAWTFTEQEMGESSTFRELLAVLKLLQRKKSLLQKQVLLTYLDSANSVRILLKFGTAGSEKCHELCNQIHAVCHTHRITLQPVWVPREENQRADALSKFFDHGEPRASVRQKLSKTFGANVVMVVPSFTNVRQELIALSSKHQSVVAVYPLFKTQAWWPGVHRAASRSVDLGTFKDVFHSRSAHAAPRSWSFRASLIDFSLLKQ